MYCSGCGTNALPSHSYCANCGDLIFASSVGGIGHGRDSSSDYRDSLTAKKVVKNRTWLHSPVTPRADEDGSLFCRLLGGYPPPLTLAAPVVPFGLMLLAFDSIGSYESLGFSQLNLGLALALEGAAFLIFLALWTYAYIKSVCRFVDDRPKQFLHLSLAALLIGFTWLLPNRFDLQKIYVGYDLIKTALSTKPYELVVFNRGRDIKVQGRLIYGVDRDVEQLLQSNPLLDTIHLESLGGYIQAGKYLGNVISSAGLKTYVRRHCASACSLAFVHGKTRYISEGSRIGFHSASFGMLSGSDWSELNEYMAAIYSAAGVSDSFIDKVLRTPAEEMWYPSSVELKEAGVVDQIIDGAILANPIKSEALGFEDIQAELQKWPSYQALKMHFPAVYEDLLEKIRQMISDGLPMIEIQSAIKESLFTDLFPLMVTKADSEVLLSYLKVSYQQMKYLLSNDPRACAYLINPATFTTAVNPVSVLPEELLISDHAALAAVIKSASRGSETDDKAQQETSFQEVWKRFSISQPELANVIESPPSSYLEQEALYCSAFVALWERLLKHQNRQVARQAARYLLSP